MTPFVVPARWLWRPSPNHNSRGATRVSAIVLHADASKSAAGTLRYLATPESEVSYHVIVDRDGTTYAVVNPDRRAWHAGKSALAGVADCNTYSVGVCLSNINDGVEPYPATQVDAAADVCAFLASWFSIPTSRIVTHAAVALPLGRKTDPKGLDVESFRLLVASKLKPVHR